MNHTSGLVGAPHACQLNRSVHCSPQHQASGYLASVPPFLFRGAYLRQLLLAQYPCTISIFSPSLFPVSMIEQRNCEIFKKILQMI